MTLLFQQSRESAMRSVVFVSTGLVAGYALDRWCGRPWVAALRDWLVSFAAAVSPADDHDDDDDDTRGIKTDSSTAPPISALVRPNIRALTPYRCARDDYAEGVLLDANENAYGPALRATDQRTRDLELHRYPDPYSLAFKELWAAYRGVSHENIFVGVGSDEAIDILFRVFCEPRHHDVVICPPTYGMYKVCAAANDVRVFTAPLEPETFDLDVDSVLETATAATRLVVVTHPGNPTAKGLSRDRVLTLLNHLPSTCLLVIDEAYVDFVINVATTDGGSGSETSSSSSFAPLVNAYERLVVLHTLSKAFGLAGARVGTAIASRDVVAYMNTLKAPYNMNKLTADVACDALKDTRLVRESIMKLVAQRETLRQRLDALSFVEKVYPSDANFLLVKFCNAAKVKTLYKTLADNGVVVRFRGDQLHCDGCLRITVGTQQDNDALLAKLNHFAPTVLLQS